MLDRPGWVVWDHRDGALLLDLLAKLVGVVGGVGHDHLSGQALDQGSGLWGVAALPAREAEPDRAT